MDAARSPNQAFAEAVQMLGSQTIMAERLGVSQMAVSRWVRGRPDLPAEHVLAVETATGISRHDLRPDIYPREAATVGDAGAMEPAR